MHDDIIFYFSAIKNDVIMGSSLQVKVLAWGKLILYLIDNLYPFTHAAILRSFSSPPTHGADKGIGLEVTELN